MHKLRYAASAAVLSFCLTPSLGHAQNLDDVLKRLEKLEQENRDLRQEVSALKDRPVRTADGPSAPVAATDSYAAPTAAPTQTASADAADDEGLFVSTNHTFSYAMLDPTTRSSRKPLYLLESRKSGALKDGGIYLGGAVTALVDYQSSNRDSKFGYLMRHPTSNNQIGKTVSEAVLHSAQLSVTANVTPWITAYAEVLYDPEQSFGAGTITALARNQLQLRKGYVMFGDLRESPFYAAVGKMEAPFGWTDTVNPFTASSVWHAFAGLSWGALAGYSKDGLNIAVEAVQGGSEFRSLATSVRGTNVPSRLNNYVIDANYTFDLGAQGRSLLAGASYVKGTAYCTTFPVQHFNACPDETPAYALYSQLRWDRLTLNGEYIKTTKVWPGTFNPTPPLNKFAASKVTSFDVGAKYVADVGGVDLHLSADYSTFIAGPEGSPWRRQDQTVLGLAVFPAPSVKLFTEWVRVDGYSPLNFISGGNLGPGVSWSDANARDDVLLAGANVAF